LDTLIPSHSKVQKKVEETIWIAAIKNLATLSANDKIFISF